MDNKFNYIKLQKIGLIGEITLNNPEKLNIIQQDTFQEINTAIDLFENDSEINVILFNAECGISKTGKKVFSAGVDLKKYDQKFELIKNDPEEFKKYLLRTRSVMNRVENSPKPVVIAINGITAGGFFEFALYCDIILISDSSILSLNEVNIGLIPGYGGIGKLLNIVGKNRAFEIISSGRQLFPQEVLDFGIAAKIFKDENFKDSVLEYCFQLAQKPVSSIALIKDTIQKTINIQINNEIEVKNFIKASSSHEAKERIKLFLKSKT